MARVDDYAKALRDGVAAALPLWVERAVRHTVDHAGGTYDAHLSAEATAAGRSAARDIVPRLTALLDADIDEQATTPLALLRSAVAYPTAVLRAAGVPPVRRDGFDAERFPDDLYGLTPATYADIDEALGPIGLAWGAAKAMAHRQRHGGDG
jgi:hypothetical protein